MTTYTPEMLRSLIPNVDHPTLNAMRNNLHNKKIDIPVCLYKDGQQVYAATVYMYGHGHSLYSAAFDATLEAAGQIEWDHASFHSSKQFEKTELLADKTPSLSGYITAYRKIGFAAAMDDVDKNLVRMNGLPVPAAKELFEQNMLRLCAAIISTSVEVMPDCAYAPVVKSGFGRFLPKFGRK